MEKTFVEIFSRSDKMPRMECRNFFHSTELFRIVEKTPGHFPFMVVVKDTKGNIMSHMLAIVRRRGSLLPPYLYTQGRVYGEGEYENEDNKEQLFNVMLNAITRKLRNRLCLYVEFSDIKTKMFGYRYFRRNGYFPVRWMEIHNSLHSKSPEERISEKTKRKIEKAYKAGAISVEAESKEEISEFYNLLKRYYKVKIQKMIPHERLFQKLKESGHCKFFVTKHKGKIIGGCTCVFSENNAYLWYMASKRKSYPKLHPDIITVWHAIKTSYSNGYSHIYFMDVGLPFRRNPYREFILKFGGKPVSTYRWFRCTIGWLNKFLSWISRE